MEKKRVLICGVFFGMMLVYSTIVWAENRTAPLDGTISFETGSADSDTLKVNSRVNSVDKTIKAIQAVKWHGASYSEITVLSNPGSGIVSVATVVNRDGKSLYQVKGVYIGGEGGGSASWKSRYKYDLEEDGALFLMDMIGGGRTVRDEDGASTGYSLICELNPHNQGIIDFYLEGIDSGTYYWNISGGPGGTWTGPNYGSSQYLDPGTYSLLVTGSDDFYKEIEFCVLEPETREIEESWEFVFFFPSPTDAQGTEFLREVYYGHVVVKRFRKEETRCGSTEDWFPNAGYWDIGVKHDVPIDDNGANSLGAVGMGLSVTMPLPYSQSVDLFEAPLAYEWLEDEQDNYTYAGHMAYGIEDMTYNVVHSVDVNDKFQDIDSYSNSNEKENAINDAKGVGDDIDSYEYNEEE